MTDQLSDNLETVDAQGNVGALFAGKVKAAGIDFDAAVAVWDAQHVVEWLYAGAAMAVLSAWVDAAAAPASYRATMLLQARSVNKPADARLSAVDTVNSTGGGNELYVQARAPISPFNKVLAFVDNDAETTQLSATILDSLGRSDFVRLFDDQLLAAAAASITTPTLPTTAKHLLLLIEARSTAVTVADFGVVQFNGDAGGNYDDERLDAFNPAGVTQGETVAATSGHVGDVPGASATAAKAGHIVVFVPNYNGATFHHGYFALSSSQRGVAAAGNNFGLRLFAGGWRSNAKITSVKFSCLSPNLDIGSRMTTYVLG